MHGNLHIFRLDTPDRPGDSLVPQYQANYTVPGHTYVRVYTEPELKDFLRATVGLAEDTVFSITRQLHEKSKFTLPDVDFTSEDIAAHDFQQMPAA